MAETYKKLPDGTLEITSSAATVICTMSKDEIEGKMAEAQTKINHLNIDLAEAQKEKDTWQKKLDALK